MDAGRTGQSVSGADCDGTTVHDIEHHPSGGGDGLAADPAAGGSDHPDRDVEPSASESGHRRHEDGRFEAVAFMVAHYVLLAVMVLALLVLALVLARTLDLPIGPMLVLPVLGLVVAWLSRPQRVRRGRLGINVSKGDQPQLHRFVSDVAIERGARPPGRLLITDGMEVMVLPGRGPLGWGARPVVAIGLPLLGLLSDDELRSLLVRQYSFLSVGDSALDRKVTRYRVARALRARRDRFEFDRPGDGFSRMYLRRSVELARNQEWTADRQTIEAGLGSQLASSVLKIEAARPILDELVARVIVPCWQRGYSVPLTAAVERNVVSLTEADWARLAVKDLWSSAPPDPADPRPTVKERVRNVTARGLSALPDWSVTPAAELLVDSPALSSAVGSWRLRRKLVVGDADAFARAALIESWTVDVAAWPSLYPAFDEHQPRVAADWSILGALVLGDRAVGVPVQLLPEVALYRLTVELCHDASSRGWAIVDPYAVDVAFEVEGGGVFMPSQLARSVLDGGLAGETASDELVDWVAWFRRRSRTRTMAPRPAAWPSDSISRGEKPAERWDGDEEIDEHRDSLGHDRPSWNHSTITIAVGRATETTAATFGTDGVQMGRRFERYDQLRGMALEPIEAGDQIVGLSITLFRSRARRRVVELWAAGGGFDRLPDVLDVAGQGMALALVRRMEAGQKVVIGDVLTLTSDGAQAATGSANWMPWSLLAATTVGDDIVIGFKDRWDPSRIEPVVAISLLVENAWLLERLVPIACEAFASARSAPSGHESR